jgi:MFS family permease
MNSTPNMSFQQRLNKANLTRPMWLLWLLSAGLIALDGFDFFIIGVALPLIEKDFGISASQTGALAVAAIAGSLVGSLTLGAITDKIGRQLMLIIDISIFLVASLGTAVAWNIESLIFFRFLVGIAIGADYPISVAYITENVPERFRGQMVISAFSFQGVGALLGALVGIGVIWSFGQIYPNPEPLIVYGWRWMLGVGLLLAILVAVLRFQFLLESPSYHIAREEYEQASYAASILLNESIEITRESDPPSCQPRLSYSALFAPEYRSKTLLVTIPWFLQDIATYGIGIFTPIIITTLAFAEEQDLSTQAINGAFGSAFVDLFLILGFIVAISLVDRLGRIPLQIIGFFGMALGLGLLAIASWGNTVNIFLVFTGFIIFNLLMNAGPNSTTFLLSGEVFPTSIRASGAGLAAAVAKSGAILGTYAIPILKQSLGVNNLLLILSLICILAAGFTYLFGNSLWLSRNGDK